MRMTNQKGVTLLEILIAIVVFSLGLLGLMSAATLSIRTNQDAYTGTQVVNVAQHLMGAMRQNRDGVIAGSYASTQDAIDIHTGSPNLARTCTLAAPCAPPAQATDDLRQVRLMMGQHLPGLAKSTVTCTPQAAFASVTSFKPIGIKFPYTGKCTLEVQWAEDRSGTLTKRTWIFQP
jgi:type IV pilus assembly protein PilV